MVITHNPAGRRNLTTAALIGLIASIVLLIFPAPSLGAIEPLLSDLSSELYADLDRWSQGGLLGELPSVRPYAPGDVIPLLERIAALGTAGTEADGTPGSDSARSVRLTSEADRARAYLARLQEENPKVGIEWELLLRSMDGEGYYNFSPSLNMAFMLHEQEGAQVWSEFGLNGTFLDTQSSSLRPAGFREDFDIIPDWSDFDIAGRNIQIYQFLSSVVSASRTSADGLGLVSFSAGFSRSSASPLHSDGIFQSPTAPAAPRFYLSYQRALPFLAVGRLKAESPAQSEQSDADSSFIPSLRLDMQLSALSATNNLGQGRWGDKYLMYHDLSLELLPWLRVGLVEGVVWGERLELGYLVPASVFFLSQGFSGFSDNALLGLHFTLRPASGLRIPFALYADDVHFNDLARLEFNTKYKFSAQTAVQWTPLLPWMDGLSLEYTAVMPYMYSHWDEQGGTFGVGGALTNPNYSNYSNRGLSMGPALEPNSDRLVLNWEARPVQRTAPASSTGALTQPSAGLILESLQLGSTLRYTRHGNASAGIIPGGTGDIFDPGYIGSTPTFQSPFDDPTGQPYTRFLTQDVLEHNLQAEARIRARVGISLPDMPLQPVLPAAAGLELGLRYIFENIWNADLVEGRGRTGHYLLYEMMFVVRR